MAGGSGLPVSSNVFIDLQYKISTNVSHAFLPKNEARRWIARSASSTIDQQRRDDERCDRHDKAGD
jgi:hypothetical protein